MLTTLLKSEQLTDKIKRVLTPDRCSLCDRTRSGNFCDAKCVEGGQPAHLCTTTSPATQLVVGAIGCILYRKRKRSTLQKMIRELYEQPADNLLKVDLPPVWVKSTSKETLP